jgi:hypothetical protein
MRKELTALLSLIESTGVGSGRTLSHRLRVAGKTLTAFRESATLEPGSRPLSPAYPRIGMRRAFAVGERQTPILGHFSVTQPGIKACRA